MGWNIPATGNLRLRHAPRWAGLWRAHTIATTASPEPLARPNRLIVELLSRTRGAFHDPTGNRHRPGSRGLAGGRPPRRSLSRRPVAFARRTHRPGGLHRQSDGARVEAARR